MPVYVALLRAVNVGGTATLPMAELKALCEGLGFADVKTYIQSGNVLFRSELAEGKVQTRLEEALTVKMGKTPGVILRSRRDLEAIVAKAPFPDAKPNFLLVTFLPEAPAADAFDKLVAPDGEEVKIDGREIYIHYPNGSGRSKLKLPALKSGTARNLNTVCELAELAAVLEDEGA
ncbi:DUF1697 domain-containing protein [Sinorhizobium sp. CCBAU 05631]|uniref:DUF1697 domain-containing protein n=1 Tax=Sinorhizobium sp. CCBAU 05631 TaxID=794846 RepID=UPI0004B01503|nr:DUF1697 domain-containing protein [Sinorhizobium sp. CCBAU 05631]ASY55672.1 hypothetical protein SS05631_c07190 [Sinorhizobium sp. CCBAU 05631]